MRKLPDFVPTLFNALMGFLLDVEDDPLWHTADSDAHEEVRAGAARPGGRPGGGPPEQRGPAPLQAGEQMNSESSPLQTRARAPICY
jgi:hypothetical protein